MEEIATAYNWVVHGLENNISEDIRNGIDKFSEIGYTNKKVDRFIIRLIQSRPDWASNLIPYIHTRFIDYLDVMIQETHSGQLMYFKDEVYDELKNGGITVPDYFKHYEFNKLHDSLNELQQYLINDNYDGILNYWKENHMQIDPKFDETIFTISVHPIFGKLIRTTLLGLTALFNANSSFKSILLNNTNGINFSNDGMSILDLACYANNIEVIRIAADQYQVKASRNTFSICTMFHRNGILEFLLSNRDYWNRSLSEIDVLLTIFSDGAKVSNYHAIELVMNSNPEIMLTSTDFEANYKLEQFLAACVGYDDYIMYKGVCDILPALDEKLNEYKERQVWLAIKCDSDDTIKNVLHDAAVKYLNEGIMNNYNIDDTESILEHGIRPTIDTNKLYDWLYDYYTDKFWHRSDKQEIIDVFIKQDLDKWNGLFAKYEVPYTEHFTALDDAIMKNDIKAAELILIKNEKEKMKPSIGRGYLYYYIRNAFDNGHKITNNLKDDVDIWYMVLDEYGVYDGNKLSGGGKCSVWMLVLFIAVIIAVIVMIVYTQMNDNEGIIDRRNA